MRTTLTPTRRGLTLVELLISLTITVVIGMALTGVVGAVVSGVDVRRDSRAHVVRGYAAQSRLAAYIVPSRAFLQADDGMIVLWFDDSRKSDTVHATEVRWLEFDETAQTITAHFVAFPENWTTVERWLADREHSAASNWPSVLKTYQDAGHVQSAVLVDGIAELRITTDASSPVQSKSIVAEMAVAGETGDWMTQVAFTLRRHSPPSK